MSKAIKKLIKDIEKAEWENFVEMKSERSDADNVHLDGFYFFDINVHRTMVLILFDDLEATIVWAGSHQEYDKTFKGNKKTIEKWLRNQYLI